MPANAPQRPPTASQLVTHNTDDSPEGRAIQTIARSVTEIERRQVTRDIVVVDLTVGDNRIVHALGRRPQIVMVMPTDADATFAWACSTRDERVVVITVVGAAQPGAVVEVS